MHSFGGVRDTQLFSRKSLAPKGPPRPGRLAAPSLGVDVSNPRPGPAADACPLPDRALASVLLPRVVVIYILSVYINLSAAALAALLQSACLLCSLGDFPHRRLGAACPGAGGGEPGPPGSCALRSNNKRLWRGRPRRLVPDLERRGARGRGGSATLRG